MINLKRTASVISKTEVELIVMNKDIFNKKLNQYLQKSFDIKSEILIKLFNISSTSIFFKKLISLLKPITLSKGTKIIKQGLNFNNLYFIINGEIEVTHNFNKKEIMKNKFFDKIDYAKKYLFKNLNYNPIIHLEILKKGDILGEEILFLNNFLSIMNFEVKTLNATLFVLDTELFKKNLKHLLNFLSKKLYNLYNYRIKNRSNKILNYIYHLINNQKIQKINIKRKKKIILKNELSYESIKKYLNYKKNKTQQIVKSVEKIERKSFNKNKNNYKSINSNRMIKKLKNITNLLTKK